MSATDPIDLTCATWIKSTWSNGSGDCVEVARLPGIVAVRDSKDPGGAALRFAPRQWNAFLAHTRVGEYR